MRDASHQPARDGFTCPVCGRFIPTTIDGVPTAPTSGSPRRFCDPACRQAAYRRRRAGVTEDTPRQTIGGRNRRLTSTNKEAPSTTTTHN
jgi:hypothetical protein